jgi:carbon-monoxide dehydrogenase medium subunit
MIPRAFDYAVPKTIDEALALLAEHGDDAKVLTGGHSLIPMLKLRLAQPALVVDLRKVPGLVGIKKTKEGIEIGAATTHATIAASKDVPAVLSATASRIGDAQVRNVGTIGGSLVHADPAADWPAAMLATGATIVLVGPTGERTVDADHFFLGLMESAAHRDEILKAIRVPVTKGARGAYYKVAQSASGFALAGAAVELTLEGGKIGTARVGITGVDYHAYRPTAVEAALRGCKTNPDAVEIACEKAADGVDPLEDIHASSRYRAHLAKVVTKRAVLAALA